MIESIEDLIVFLKHFHRNLLEDPSLPPEMIPDDLPDGLAKIYRELGSLINLEQHPHPFATQDTLITINSLKCVDGIITFCWENQAVWSACFPANQKDPPVYSDSGNGKDFIVVCESLDHFLITLCLQEAVFGSHNFASVNGADNILEIVVREAQFKPLWLDGKYVHSDYLYDFYVSEDRDILIMNNSWIGSQTRLLVDVFDSNIDPTIEVIMS
jgi:hypothetical protein